MATRSRIGMQRNDGTIISVYCHWDGYPKHHYPILRENYNTVEKVEELISGGDISSLGKFHTAPDNVPHSWDSPANSVTVYYGRDRGELYTEPRTDGCFSEWKNRFEEYNYLFVDGIWKVFDYKGTEVTDL